MNFHADQGDEEPVDVDVLESFAQDQELDQGSMLLKRRRQQHTAESPELSADDMDATWDDADGEEAGGGATLEPDENVVDEVGGAIGLSYSDTEPLHTDAKLEQREHDGWELNPDADEQLSEASPASD
ncbi:MAG: DUF6335 family protein [Anaerolineae bacterium]